MQFRQQYNIYKTVFKKQFKFAKYFSQIGKKLQYKQSFFFAV